MSKTGIRIEIAATVRVWVGGDVQEEKPSRHADLKAGLEVSRAFSRNTPGDAEKLCRAIMGDITEVLPSKIAKNLPQEIKP